MVLVLYLLTIFGFLRALQLEHACTSPITVGLVAGSTFFVRRTTVETISGPFAFGGGGGSHVLQLLTTALPRDRVGLMRLPSSSLLSRALASQMLAKILVDVGVILPFPPRAPGVTRGHTVQKRSFSLSMANSINRSTRSS